MRGIKTCCHCTWLPWLPEQQQLRTYAHLCPNYQIKKNNKIKLSKIQIKQSDNSSRRETTQLRILLCAVMSLHCRSRLTNRQSRFIQQWTVPYMHQSIPTVPIPPPPPGRPPGIRIFFKVNWQMPHRRGKKVVQMPRGRGSKMFYFLRFSTYFQ